jgi:hypothetical protein
MENLQNHAGNQNGKDLPKQNQANNMKDSRRKTDSRRNIRWWCFVYTGAAR